MSGAAGTVEAPCRCGHSQDAHDHYRRGTDCAVCSCPRFRSTSSLASRLLRRLGAR